MGRFYSIFRTALMWVGVLLLLITFTPLVPWAAARLCVEWSDRDGEVLIVLLGTTVGDDSDAFIGANSYWRAVYAVRSWHYGRFRKVLLCGKGSAETVKPVLIAYGVPADAILVENRSTSTHENVLNAKPLLAGLHGPFVLLTSDYHMLRASRCFARENVPVITRPVPDVLKRSRTLQLRWEGFWTLGRELCALAYYKVHGWI
jgi:uncharacterized SAM-binding protein YcdF (DUF218 family)